MFSGPSRAPWQHWVQIFSQDEMATTAILDRLFHRSHIFNIDGRSFRLRNLNMRLKGPAKEEG